MEGGRTRKKLTDIEKEGKKKQGTNSLKDDKETNKQIPSERNVKNKSRIEKYAKIKTDKN